MYPLQGEWWGAPSAGETRGRTRREGTPAAAPCRKTQAKNVPEIFEKTEGRCFNLRANNFFVLQIITFFDATFFRNLYILPKKFAKLTQLTQRIFG
jgi:hypothetical protein